MVLISGDKIFTKVITWRRNNDFHFSPKGKNGAQNAICPSGVKTQILRKFVFWYVAYSNWLTLCGSYNLYTFSHDRIPKQDRTLYMIV